MDDARSNTNQAYIRIRISYIVNIIFLLYVSAALEAILRQMHYKGYITEFFVTVHKCKVLSFKKHIYVLNIC